jgi:hypothetical protein
MSARAPLVLSARYLTCSDVRDKEVVVTAENKTSAAAAAAAAAAAGLTCRRFHRVLALWLICLAAKPAVDTVRMKQEKPTTGGAGACAEGAVGAETLP